MKLRRHCERSEANHLRAAGGQHGLLARNDAEDRSQSLEFGISASKAEMIEKKAGSSLRRPAFFVRDLLGVLGVTSKRHAPRKFS
ncbi:MAG: hypothetical protein ABSA13_04540 [Beijerinckiaceae bacterium]|jgi:hypothetical protein